MQWFFIALAAPAIWAIVNHVDKYIITKYFSGRGVGSLVIFTSVSGFIAAVFILIFNPAVLSFDFWSAVIIASSGALLVASFIPYLYALEKEEASIVSTLFQMIPVFGYFLALIFLKEVLSAKQIISSLFIIAGAIIISLDLSVKINFKLKILALMILSSFMIAINGLIFKVIALKENFWGTAFWEYIGGALFGLGLFCFVRLYRRQFLATIAKSRFIVLGLNSISELLNIVAKLLANFASLLAPLALVWVVNGFQPLIVFIYGIIITIFLPQLGKEALTKKIVFQKLIAIGIIFIGVYNLLR